MILDPISRICAPEDFAASFQVARFFCLFGQPVLRAANDRSGWHSSAASPRAAEAFPQLELPL